MMLFNTDRKISPSQLRTLSVLLLHLLTRSCGAQPQLIGSSQPIVATLSDDVIVPCRLEPADDVSDLTLEWARPDLSPRFVHVRRSGTELVSKKHKSFEGRTSLFIDELRIGNASLKISNVTLADRGTYKCYLPGLERQSLIPLVVGAASPAVISLSGMDRDKGGVVMDCGSRGWYPEPEVLWLDGEGKLLSAGPTETVRGPDDLYTVSSRVTVEKRHSNSFTCRVHQRTTNQTRETHITVPDDFFKLQSSAPIITGLALSLVGNILFILFILSLLFVWWRWRQNTIKNKRSSSDGDIEGEKEKNFKTNKSEDQSVTEDREREQLMRDGAMPMQVIKDNEPKKSKHKRSKEQQRREQQQRREEAKEEVQTLKEELQTKKNELETQQAELQKLHEDKKRNETELQNLKEELKNREEIIQKTQSRYSFRVTGLYKEEQTKRKEVEALKKTLEIDQEELNTNMKKVEDREAEVQQLQDQIQRMQTNLQTLLESNNTEVESSRAAAVQSSSSVIKWPVVSRQSFQEQQQRREEAEKEVQTLREELQTKNRELQHEQQRREEAEREAHTKEKELQHQNNMMEGNLVDTNNQLLLEKQRSQSEVETLKNQLKKELENTERAAETLWKKSNEEKREARNQLESKDEEISQLKRELEQKLSDQIKKAEEDKKLLNTKHVEWEKRLREETTRREKAERRVETLKKELNTKVHANRHEESEHHSHQEDSSSASGPVIVIGVDQQGKYISLTNKSNQEQQLGGWRLEMEVNRRIISYTFEKSFSLKFGGTTTMTGPGCMSRHSTSDLWWKDFRTFNPADELKFTLINITGEIRHELSSHSLNDSN